MLYIVGLGLGDERDITVRGLEAVRSSHKVYVEAYTSLLSFGLSPDGLSKLVELYGKEVTVADREMVEERADAMLSEAADTDVAFLVVGDPFGATTHTDLVVRAKKLGLKVEVIHNASVMNAVGVCGLQLYRYAYSEESKCVGLARLGNRDQMVVAGSMKELLDIDFGPPLHCLVIVGETHPVEEEMLEFYTIK